MIKIVTKTPQELEYLGSRLAELVAVYLVNIGIKEL